MRTESIIPENITVGDRRRAIIPEKVAALKESMRALGMLQPITVYAPTDEQVDLVAGAHRLQAAIELGWDGIDAVILTGDELHAQLAEIDENLCRSNLTPTQEAEHIAKRKEIWQALRDAKRHMDGEPESERIPPTLTGRGNEGFATETEKATGQSKRRVNEAVRRATEVCQEARDLIRGTKLDTGTFLDRLAKAGVSAKEQIDRVRDALDALADKEKADALSREAAARRKAAKDDAYAACNEISAFLFEKLTTREWAALIDKFERAGWTTPAKSLRNWEPPQAKAA